MMFRIVDSTIFALAKINQNYSVCRMHLLKAASGVWGVKGGIRGATSQFKPPCPPLKRTIDSNTQDSRILDSAKPRFYRITNACTHTTKG